MDGGGKNQKEEEGANGTPLAGWHPIGVVARRTGLTVHVLRAWERRYGVVTPERGPGGQRGYTDDDIAKLRLLRQATESGRSISSVASLSVAELDRLVEGDNSRAPREGGGDGDREIQEYVSEVLMAGERMDGDAAYATLMRAMVALRPLEFHEEVLLPLLREVGERWHAGGLGAAQEHVVSVAARRALTWLLQAYDSRDSGPLLISSTVAGELHEFGAMVTSAVALEEGWRVAYLGPSLPAEELERGAQLLRARIVALSIVRTEGSDPDVLDEVTRLRALLPRSCSIVVGGVGALALRAELESIGVIVLSGLDGLRTLLRLHRS